MGFTMKNKIQFIVDEASNPLFAVVPYQDYLNLTANQGEDGTLPSGPSLLSSDGLTIRLPYGGPGASIAVLDFLEMWFQSATDDMAINQRAQSFDKFPDDQRCTLDPVIRRSFLPENSPYKNTMQATTDVVEALLETGLFSRISKKYPYFYRPVKAIKIDWPLAIEFMKKHGK
jgi:hypothetical protein